MLRTSATTYPASRKTSNSRPLLKTPQLLVIREDETADWMIVMAAFVLRIANRRLPGYSCAASPQKFTQPQLITCLVLKNQLGRTYRAVVQRLDRSPKLRRLLGLRAVPDHSTLKRFADRATTPAMLSEIRGEAFEKTRRFGQWTRRWRAIPC